VLLYLRRRGLKRAAGKLMSAYAVGRQEWYLTIEDLSQWVGVPFEPNGLEFREARPEDLPRMRGFTARQHVRTLATWSREDHFFFIAVRDGVPISYRCLSTRVHLDVRDAIRLRAHQLFVVDEYTVPSHRRRGITRLLAIATNPIVMARGYREVVGVHRTDNDDTIAATRRKAIVTLGTLTCSRLGWKTWFTWRSGTHVDAPLALNVRGRHRAVVPHPVGRAA
jgi:hypothetical protein